MPSLCMRIGTPGWNYHRDQTRNRHEALLFVIPFVPAIWFVVVECRKQFSHRIRRTRALLREFAKEARPKTAAKRPKEVGELAKFMWRLTAYWGFIEDALSYRRFEDFNLFKAAEARRAKEQQRSEDPFETIALWRERAVNEIVADDCRTDFTLPSSFAEYDPDTWNKMKQNRAKL
jgi:hypothetical protein